MSSPLAATVVGSREIGVRTDRMKIYSFMILGAMVAFAGIISAVEFSSTDPDVGTSTLTLQTIAAAVIGGTSLAGGSGTTIGALIGAFVVSALQNGLVLVGAQATESDIFLGIAIVAAMILNVQVGKVRFRRRAMNIQERPIILRAEHVSKSFGAVTALRDVSIQLHQGEVLALVGDNGAGKSTFIKILSGFHAPDSGTLEFEGKPLHMSSPLDARNIGIETCYQDLALINDLSVYHNMFLGREVRKRYLGFLPLLDNSYMRQETRKYLDGLGINLPSVDSTVALLSGGQRQSIAVARAIQSSPKLLILDEPLAALGVRESAHVLGLIDNLRQQRKVSIILIVHNYNQVFEVCDRINFLYAGEIVLDVATAETSEEELVRIVKSGRGRAAMEAMAATAI